MFFDTKAVSYFTLVQINTAAGAATTNYQFPDQPELRGRKIQKIVAYNDQQVPSTPNNIPVVTLANLSESYLVLYVNEREDIKMSLTHLVSSTSSTGATFATNNGYLPLNDLNIIWSKSYVKVPSGNLITGGASFIFGVFYR
jgi:hypothetical protein